MRFLTRAVALVFWTPRKAIAYCAVVGLLATTDGGDFSPYRSTNIAIAGALAILDGTAWILDARSDADTTKEQQS